MIPAFTARGVGALGAFSALFHVAVGQVGLRRRASKAEFVASQSVIRRRSLAVLGAVRLPGKCIKAQIPDVSLCQGYAVIRRELLRQIQERDLCDTHLEIVKNTRASSRMEARKEKMSCLLQVPTSCQHQQSRSAGLHGNPSVPMEAK